MKINEFITKRKKTLIVTGILTGIAITSLFLYIFSKYFPEIVTRYYSHGLFNIINLPGKWFSGLFRFSVGEILLIVAAIAIVFLFILVVVKIILSIRRKNHKTRKYLFNSLVFIIIALDVTFTMFVWSGGFNYNGLTIAAQMKYSDRDFSANELYAMTLHYIEEANHVRLLLDESDNGVTVAPYNFREMNQRASEAYKNIPVKYNKLLAAGYYPEAKPALLSQWMCYTNITGIYPYLIPESIINIKTPDFSKPSTLCHEMAHQRAIAKEDEANFISFIACTSSTDNFFKYPGYYMAILNCLNSLYSVNYQLWTEAWELLSEGVKRDIKYSGEFWENYKTTVSEISENINDAYLKANNIKDGAKSYGRLTDLLLADYYS